MTGLCEEEENDLDSVGGMAREVDVLRGIFGGE